jgi:hypothetical protein
MMDFYEVLEQVLILLQRHGRVTYRALKRQFDIDDDTLEELKEELFFAHSVADDSKLAGFEVKVVGAHAKSP